MDQSESMGFCYGYSLFEEHPREGARGYVSIYLPEPGVLKTEITEGIVNKNSAASCKESRKVLAIRDLKTVHVGGGGLNLLDLFYRDKANI
jgi:hypothetical protein